MCSVRSDGDFHLRRVASSDLERRRRAMVDVPWTLLDQCHGVEVREVVYPGHRDRSSGDVTVTGLTDAVLGCWAADCAPVVVVGVGTRVAVAHAGWRGLAAGVIGEAVRHLGEPVAAVVLGPVIGPCCYEFGADDVAAIARSLGLPTDVVTGRTAWGTTSLDVPGIVAAVADSYAAPLFRLGGCTGCTYPGFSHRRRHDEGRHVVAAWQVAS